MTDREAMQMSLDALESLQAWPETPENFKRFRAIEALRTALAQPDVPESCFGETKPVAWMYSTTGTLFDTCPQDADEGEFLPLYTSPPKREWVGLTDDEYELMAEKRVTNYFFNTLDYAHAIEAKLKEKNNG